jgi:hypothetical protein
MMQVQRTWQVRRTIARPPPFFTDAMHSASALHLVGDLADASHL